MLDNNDMTYKHLILSTLQVLLPTLYKKNLHVSVFWNKSRDKCPRKPNFREEGPSRKKKKKKKVIIFGNSNTEPQRLRLQGYK